MVKEKEKRRIYEKIFAMTKQQKGYLLFMVLDVLIFGICALPRIMEALGVFALLFTDASLLTRFVKKASGRS